MGLHEGGVQEVSPSIVEYIRNSKPITLNLGSFNPRTFIPPFGLPDLCNSEPKRQPEPDDVSPRTKPVLRGRVGFRV